MNKQQKTYVLLGAVLIIWGIIGYQFFNHFSSNDTPEIETSTFTFTPKKKTQQKGYIVKADYRDPFLGKLPSAKKKKVVAKKKTTPKATIPFPNVAYNGVVEGGTKSYILTINGNQEIMTIGQTLHKITLKKADKTSAVVVFNSEEKTIQLVN